MTIGTEAGRLVLRWIHEIWPIIVSAPLKMTAHKVPPPPVISVHATKVDTSPTITLKATALPGELGPRGWLGALFGHGNLCAMFETSYLRHHKHLLPSLAASWNKVKHRVELDYSRGTLMSRKFAEWQCPSFDSQSPDFRKMNEGVQADDWRGAIDRVVYGEGKENYWIDTFLPRDVRMPDDVMEEGQRPARAVLDWLAWTSTRDHQGKGRDIQVGMDRLFALRDNAVRVPLAWDTSDDARAIWGRRLLRWYWVAQYAVWSCEMLRVHRRDHGMLGKVAPQWWRAQCAAWGILVRDGAHPFNYTNLNALDTDVGRRLGASMMWDGTDAEWESIARRVAELALVPGAHGTLGEQIAAPGARRNVFDVPEQLGSAVPPIYLGEGRWNAYAASFWIMHNDTGNFWTDSFLPAWNSIFGFLSSFASAAFTTFVATINTVATCTAQVFRAAAALANGTMPDVVDVVTSIAAVAGQIGAVAGADLGIPDNLWDQLTSLEQVGGYVGDLGAYVEGQAEYVRSILSTAQHQDGYAFLSDLLGGVIDG